MLSQARVREGEEERRRGGEEERESGVGKWRILGQLPSLWKKEKPVELTHQ
jgi:hypothetical protein